MSKGKKQNIVLGAVCGLAAGAGAAAVMDGYWGIVKKIAGARPEQKPKGNSDEEKKEPSTQIVADKISDAVTSHDVPKKEKAYAGIGVHYATGAAYGAFFGAAAARLPRLGLLGGLAYGVAIWLFFDEITLRLLNIAPDPKKVPVEEHAQALGAHLVYGSATALFARLLLRLLGSKS
ncbi:MAG: DUF1440 domain-containing protein [Chloroflexi bacterium]|nr:DUF1440 domain-containing protein [Chloroflexota bacterium]